MPTNPNANLYPKTNPRRTGILVLPYELIMPSGDTTGATDYAAIIAAQARNPGGYTRIELGMGNFYINAMIPMRVFDQFFEQGLSATRGACG
jgi:hypothetical protein